MSIQYTMHAYTICYIQYIIYVQGMSGITTRLVGLNNKELGNSSLETLLTTETWFRVGVTFDYSTATLRQYINGVLQTESRYSRYKRVTNMELCFFQS